VLERIFRLTVVLADAMAEDLADRGLTRARATLLAQLHQAGPMTQQALANALRVTPRNITGLVRALEADGLVERAPHPTDSRALLVELSTEGRRAAEALAEEHDRLARFLLAKLPVAERKQLIRHLDLLLERLDTPAFDTLRQAGLERWPLRSERP
jgi:DNA-binding MarR family transcriptional regulator